MSATIEAPRPPGLRRVADVALSLLAPLLALVLAGGLVGYDAPVVLRTLVALPVIVAVAGTSATRLLLGPAVPTDPVLRTLLAVVLGSVALLASLLATQALGRPVAGSDVLQGARGLAVVLLVTSRLRVGGPPRTRPDRSWIRPTLGVAAGALVLGAAVHVAAGLPPTTEERYTLLGFADPTLRDGAPVSARPGGVVRMDLALSSFGQPLPDGRPQADLTISGQETTQPTLTWGPVVVDPPPARGAYVPAPRRVPVAVEHRSVRVAFTAPDRPGLYALDLRVTVPGGQPLTLTRSLQVNG